MYLCIWFWELSKKKWDVAELRWNKRNKNCLALNHNSIKRVVTTSENISKLQCFAIRACSMVQHKRVGVDHTASLKGISSLKAIMCRMNLCIKRTFERICGEPIPHICQFWGDAKKGHRPEKSTPPPVLAVVTYMIYGWTWTINTITYWTSGL